ncbi:ligand-binding sensor domain-containing protein, partial [Desulfamplus magnetovallimortis]|uniref:ligand-binding sensor domain-containing protein n=1 Tax=Desulfamplus magnetovallimortis TaxID=1246637 RepID=UPI001C9441F5
VGTPGGLAHLKADSTWETPEQLFHLPSNYPIALLSDGEGGIWVGTDGTNAGLGHLKADDTWNVFDPSNSDLPHSSLSSLLSDGQGGIWAGTWDGLAHLKPDNSWEVFNWYNVHWDDNNIESLLSDGQGGIWVGTQREGLRHLTLDNTWQIFDHNNSDLPSDYIRSLLSDGHGGIWVGTGKGLVHIMSDDSWEILDQNNSDLPGNSVSALLSDGQEGIWMGTHDGLAHMNQDGTWEVLDEENSDLPENYILTLLSDGQGSIWVGTFNGLALLRPDRTWELFNEENSHLPYNIVRSLLLDGLGGIWAGTEGGGLAHLLLTGSPEQVPESASPALDVSPSHEIRLNWFLNSAPIDYQDVIYIELQRSLSKIGPYETVHDTSDKPVRFYTDYADCSAPRIESCWPTLEGHTPTVKGTGETQIKGYILNDPVIDPEWLEGLPRYYRLSVVTEKNGQLVRYANTSESTLMTPSVEENPRIGLTMERSAIAMLPGTTHEISVFVSSLDLFTGDVQLGLESDNPGQFDIQLNPASVVLTPGETVSSLLKIQVPSEGIYDSESTIKLIPETKNGSRIHKSSSLKVRAGTEPMIALSIAQTNTRPRVMDSITVFGNVIPAQGGQEVVISGNSIDPITLLTSDDGSFQGAMIPKSAGLITLTAQSNGITSNSAELFILSARTHIVLSSNVNQETSRKDTLRVQGIMTPVRLNEPTIHLDIRYLDPTDPEGSLKPQFVGDVSVDETGIFYRDIVVPGDGFINVKASLPETSDFLSIETKLVIPVGQPVGEGIIVVSEAGTPEFQDISKTLGRYVYNALKNRNIPPERIRYLGISDENDANKENGGDDGSTIPTDGNADKNNLQHALTQWAISLISTDDPYKTPLNLYLIGAVENGSFRLNDTELLTADELAGYLDDAETAININNDSSSSRGFPVTIVLEGSQSGEWIEKIAGKGRIILTSSSAKPLDEGGYAGYENIGESSFSRYFYQFINYGSDIEGSFAEANYEILKFYRHIQRPVMDADGDGVGTTKYDRYEASGKFIEYRPSGNLRPQIRTTNPDMTITRPGQSQNSHSQNTLWAIATDPETELQGVFCSITDPSNRTVNIELIRDKGDMYTADFNADSQVGCHQLVYYAKDMAGNVSLPVEKFVNIIASGVNQDDGDAILKTPHLILSTEGTTVTISWSEVANANGYTLFYAPYPDADYIEKIDMEKLTSITFDGTDMGFYVAVQAYNNKEKSEFSNIDSFELR